MYVRTRLDNVPFVESEEVAGEAPEQQLFGEVSPHCNHYSGEDEGYVKEFQEFQDFEEF